MLYVKYLKYLPVPAEMRYQTQSLCVVTPFLQYWMEEFCASSVKTWIKACHFSFSLLALFPLCLWRSVFLSCYQEERNRRQLGCKLLTFPKLDDALCESGTDTDNAAVVNDEQYLTWKAAAVQRGWLRHWEPTANENSAPLWARTGRKVCHPWS